MKIEMRAHVITRDGHEVGEVHRVVVDIENQAVVAIVVLKGRLLSRDILVPIDFVDRTDDAGATGRLRLLVRHDRLSADLPDDLRTLLREKA